MRSSMGGGLFGLGLLELVAIGVVLVLAAVVAVFLMLKKK